MTGWYEMFLSRLPEKLSIDDLPAALAWTKKQGSRHERNYEVSNLIDGIIMRSWELIDHPHVVQILADAILVRLKLDYGRLLDRDSLKGLGFLKNDDTRRQLLSEIMHQSDYDKDVLFYVSRAWSCIAGENDLDWILEQAIASKTTKACCGWTNLGWWNSNTENPDHVNRLIQIREEDPRIEEILSDRLDPLELESESSKKLKEQYYKYSRLTKEEEVKKIDPYEIVTGVLGACESGNPEQWWYLIQVLTLESHSTHYGDHIVPDIRELVGWKELTPTDQNRVVDAAKMFIQNADDRSHSWLSKPSLVDYYAMAGYQALRLISNYDKSYVRNITAALWKKWAAGILAFDRYLSDEERILHQAVVTELFRKIPAKASRCVVDLIERESGKTGHYSVLESVSHIKTPILITHLKKFAQTKGYVPRRPYALYKAIIEFDESSLWVLEELPENLPKNKQTVGYKKSIEAMEALCWSLNEHSWGKIWKYTSVDAACFKKIVFHMAGLRSKEIAIDGLAERQLADLYLLVSQHYPHAKDPQIGGAHTVTFRENISIWRDNTVLTTLKNKGSSSACSQLKRIMESMPDQKWLQYTWLEAVRIMRTSSWEPLSPAELLALARSNSKRIVRSESDLEEIILESLERYEIQLHGQTPTIRSLWDYQRKERSWTPADENPMSDNIAAYLRRELEEQEIIVNREVEIRPARGNESGQDTDFLIEAFPAEGPTNGAVQIIIEAKGCWHNELKTAMKTQLKDRYIKDNLCRTGIYLVGYFSCGSWAGSDDRKNRTPSMSLHEMRDLLRDQAKTLSDNTTSLTARVLDCRLDR